MSRSALTRRGLFQASFAGALATAGQPLFLSACGTNQPSAPVGAGAGNSTNKTSPYPTYLPLANGPKPDYHTDDPRYDDGSDNYPSSPIKAVADVPGTGSTLTSSPWLKRGDFPFPGGTL